MDAAIDLVRSAIVLSLKISVPLLVVGLVVGLLVSILQTATQLQEQTLVFVPKILAVVVTIFVMLPWLLRVMVEYTITLFRDMAQFMD